LAIGLTCISHHIKLSIFLIKLCENHSKTQNTPIYVQLEGMASNKSPQNGCRTKPTSFQLLKNLFLCIPPNELFITFGQLSWFGNMIKAFDKPLVIVCQPQEHF
jgi:hypothetical protein